jgi:hypothetical protein
MSIKPWELPSVPIYSLQFGEVVKEKLIIRLGVETRLAVVTAFHDVNG